MPRVGKLCHSSRKASWERERLTQGFLLVERRHIHGFLYARIRPHASRKLRAGKNQWTSAQNIVQSETAQDVNKQQDIMEVQERTCGLVRNNVNDRDFVQHNPLTPTGFERVSTTTIPAKDLSQTSLSSAAKFRCDSNRNCFFGPAIV